MVPTLTFEVVIFARRLDLPSVYIYGVHIRIAVTLLKQKLFMCTLSILYAKVILVCGRCYYPACILKNGCVCPALCMHATDFAREP